MTVLEQDVSLLQCVDCGGDLVLQRGEVVQGMIRHGLLQCTTCARFYPVINQVGIFFAKAVLADYLTDWERDEIHKQGYDASLEGDSSLDQGHLRQLAVAKNWEYQWIDIMPYTAEELDQDNFYGSRVFWQFIPVEKDLFKGAWVFIGCGGGGKESYHVSNQDPERIIVVELGQEIYHTPRLFIKEKRQHLLLLRGDICRMPLKPNTVDIAICDHALQHVLDHKSAFARMTEITRPGGQIAVCVYSYENNFVMTHLVEPAKRIIHKLPLKVQRLFSWPPALLIFLLIRGIYLPLGRLSKKIACRLPLYQHMMLWAPNPLNTIWITCFDLIHAPISYHFRKEEMTSLVRENQLIQKKLHSDYGTTWSLVAEKPL